MDESKYFEPNIFLISLTIGLVVTYLIIKQPKVIIRYPNLENYKNTVYVDDNNVEYKYEKKDIKL